MKKTFEIFATLNSLEKERAMRYHDNLLNCSGIFKILDVKITLITTDSQGKLDSVKELYNSPIRYIGDADNQLLKESVRSINVFGNRYTTVRPYMRVYDEKGKLIAQAKRMNEKSVLKLAEKVYQYRKRNKI